ncbi:MAG: TerC family protein [Candidatus Acidiferrum sp.]
MSIALRWILFNLLVIAAIVLDLRVFHRRPHKISIREAAAWSAVWVSVSVLFGIGMLIFLGRTPALEFFTGYLIEKALSVDNLFIFLVIFRSFGVDDTLQHRLLEWGIVGALIMRGAMILAGAAAIQHFSWVMYVLGAFLIYAGAHMAFAKAPDVHPEENFVFRMARRHLRITPGYQGQHFFVRQNGLWFATPLFLVLLIIEISDVALAVDSIPAIFGVTRDPFIVYSSNVLAILGLRALYFLLAGFLDRLHYLDEGLALLLAFIGAKMIAERWIHISVEVSLLVVAGILLLALSASLLLPKKPTAVNF